ncbi:unnamed protein product, partial [Symbiodinium natans]
RQGEATPARDKLRGTEDPAAFCSYPTTAPRGCHNRAAKVSRRKQAGAVGRLRWHDYQTHVVCRGLERARTTKAEGPRHVDSGREVPQHCLQVAH